jgi:hypothetical protein
MSRLARIQPRQWLLIALVLIATGVLTFALRDAVRESVVIPLTFAAWMGDIMLRSVPQALLLGVLVMLCLFIVLRGATRNAGATSAPLRPATVTAAHASRLLFWARQLTRMEDSQFAVEKLALELKKLIVNILSVQENMPEDDVVDAVQRGDLRVPDDVRRLIIRPQDWMKAKPVNPWELFLRRLRPNRPPKTDPALTQKLEGAIRYIEQLVQGERILE